MKKIFSITSTILNLLIIGNISSQNNKSINVPISDLIVYEVTIKNPAKISMDTSEKNNLTGYQGQTINDYMRDVENKYLSNYQNLTLTNELKKALNNNKIVFFDDCGKSINAEVTKNKTHQYDEIRLLTPDGEDSVDVNGNVMYKQIRSDFHYLNNMSKLRFFEEWKFNSLTGMNEKVILGYEIISEKDIKGSLFEVPLFGIAKDKTSLEKIRKYKLISGYCGE
ncbi:MAG: hypothetical protein ACK5D5_00340 [Bacteroidota bacterium]|jgi:hypothetical protein